ncbi:ELL-associated factor 1 [Bicyclus anynana]|uniref:Ell-associated factor Eaf n=1 Tax=Bicyclus anynana TaxID=110368 RepID=A0A6J1NHB3_BICAN|nr:ELL-associated factor 1 [Bicyclus anynana]XP_023942482.1 ELL-associated factor 1 [Bicyclus anynana]
MADKHSLNYDVRELKLGASFTNNKASQYHTIKYDFKPASVDVNKMATVDVETNNQVTVTVPHLDGAGVPQTVFKGSQRPYTKECVLIIDRVTGEITLEKLSSNITVKKTRQETAQKPRPLTPVTADFMNTTQRSSSRTRVTTNKRTNNNQGAANVQPNGQPRFNAGAQKSQNMVRSPPRVKTSPPQAPWSGGGNSTHASLPMIGLDDALAGTSPPPAPAHNAHGPAHNAHGPAHNAHGSAHNAHGSSHNAHGPSHKSHAPAHNAHGLAHNAHAPHAPAQARHLPPPAAIPPPPVSIPPPVAHTQPQAARQEDSSSSSSSDSDSGSGSDSDSDDNDSAARPPLTNGNASNAALPTDVLNDDLCLSESGSDSD